MGRAANEIHVGSPGRKSDGRHPVPEHRVATPSMSDEKERCAYAQYRESGQRRSEVERVGPWAAVLVREEVKEPRLSLDVIAHRAMYEIAAHQRDNDGRRDAQSSRH